MDIEIVQLKVNGFSEIINHVLSEIPQAKLMKRRGNNISCCCPFHEEKTPSFGIDAENGKFNCFACGESGGGILTFLMRIYGITCGEAYKKVYSFYGIENDFVPNKEKKKVEEHIFSQSIIDEMNVNIKGFTSKKRRELIEQQWGISDFAFFDKYQLGWSDKKDRFAIPIFDKNGQCRNIRIYSFEKRERDAGRKMISWAAGSGENRLYPISSLKENEIWICEGEKDALVALNKGINAITTTTGAGSWNPDFNKEFLGKKVNICFDVDGAGSSGAANIAHQLYKFAKEIRIIDLPLAGTKTDKDLSDFFIKNFGTKENLETLRDKTVIYTEVPASEVIPIAKVINADEEKIDIVKWISPDNHDVIMEATVTFVGTSKDAHCVPKDVIFKCEDCGKVNNKPCGKCHIGLANGGRNGGTLAKTFKQDDRELLKYVNLNENELELSIRKNVDNSIIPRKCAVKCTVSKYHHIYQNFMVNQYSPVRTTKSSEYDTTTEAVAYTMGFSVKENNCYKIKCSLVSLPQNSKTGYMITHAEPISDFIDQFKLSDEDFEALKVFQNEEKTITSIMKKLNEIHTDFRDNVTGIIGRENVHLAADICYHSCLYFEIPGDKMHRGQIDCCIMGDTRTGKNGVVDAYKNYYGLGAGLSGEAVSFAGLVGGCVQSENRMVIRWGRMPINDRGLVIIDETSGMDADVISKLSSVRTDGVAKITKVGVSESQTNTRCRIVWIANPRDGKALGDNSYPIKQLVELFGKSEDVSRLDFACLVEQDELLNEEINSIAVTDRERVPHIYTSDLCRKLVCWAWSRKAKNIIISQETKHAIYNYTKSFADEYKSDLPLVEPANFRVKLTKVAIAIAARLFSTEDGENLILDKSHVFMAVKFLNDLYTSKSSRYKDYCERYKLDRRLISEPELKELIDAIRLKFPESWPAFECLMSKQNEHYYSKEDFEICLGIPSNSISDKIGKTGRDILHKLEKSGAFEAHSGRYKRKHAFKMWFKNYVEMVNKESQNAVYKEMK